MGLAAGSSSPLFGAFGELVPRFEYSSKPRNTVFVDYSSVFGKIRNVASGKFPFPEGRFAAVNETADSRKNAGEILVGAN